MLYCAVYFGALPLQLLMSGRPAPPSSSPTAAASPPILAVLHATTHTQPALHTQHRAKGKSIVKGAPSGRGRERGGGGRGVARGRWKQGKGEGGVEGDCSTLVWFDLTAGKALSKLPCRVSEWG